MNKATVPRDSKQAYNTVLEVTLSISEIRKCRLDVLYVLYTGFKFRAAALRLPIRET